MKRKKNGQKHIFPLKILEKREEKNYSILNIFMTLNYISHLTSFKFVKFSTSSQKTK